MVRGVKCVIRQGVAVCKLFFLFLFALFLPRIFLSYGRPGLRSIIQSHSTRFKLGLETISDSFLQSLSLNGKVDYSVALITNQTGKDQFGNRNIDILLSKGVKIKKIFTPQHGFSGTIRGSCDVADGVDTHTHIPIISLYKKGHTKKLRAIDMNDIDILFFDIQDAGMRHYSYIKTLLSVIEAAAEYNKTLVVLDRPNLLGNCMEGSLVANETHNVQEDAAVNSSIPIPVRHGMTVGELAHYCNKHVVSKQANLHIVPMEHYYRYCEVRRPLISHLSPNITSIDSCYGYSFLGLLGEVIPFDIGIGTDKAFQCILLPEHISFPKQEWYELRILLKKHGVESTFYRYFSKRKKCYCSGLRLMIPDINSFSSFNTLLSVLDFFKESGLCLSFSSYFDNAIGTSMVRRYIEGHVAKKELEHEVNKNLRYFYTKAFDSFIYKPLPKVVML